MQTVIHYMKAHEVTEFSLDCKYNVAYFRPKGATAFWRFYDYTTGLHGCVRFLSENSPAVWSAKATEEVRVEVYIPDPEDYPEVPF